jgi:hypothetical protein
VELKQFNDVLVGVAWETDPARQALLGGTSGTGLRYRKDLAAGAAWPVTMTNAIPLTDHDYVAWIDDYEPLSGVWVMRNGDWRQADDVMVRRAGFWEPANGVKVRRSGVWTDAS